MKIAIAQINPKVGDINANALKIETFARKAENLGADIAVFPELALTGYPPLDLLENRDFIRENLAALGRLAALKLKTAMAVGYAEPNPGKKGKGLLNSAAFISGGRITVKRAKSLLPAYDIFDETRHFEPAAGNKPFKFRGETIGLTICEDIWAETPLLPKRFLYRNNPVKTLRAGKTSIVINISASPYYKGKSAKRRAILSGLAKKMDAFIIYANQTGANDELIFDGNSFALDPSGRVISRAAAFEEDLLIIDTLAAARKTPPGRDADPDEILSALTLGIRDYFRKLGFKHAVLGLSGGIDSAVVAALAARALGPNNVTGVLMSSPYTSGRSVNDALALAKNLGIESRIIPIKDVYSRFLKELGGTRKAEVSLAMQNIQARIRGTILMALANSNNWLALATGNKSEIALGYCTLYGDTAGAMAPISDLLKTEVYRLAGRINSLGILIPTAIISRPPTAELKPGQKDQDDLPPYPVLDSILRLYMEENRTPAEIIGKGYKAELVLSIIKRVERNEYKRRQLPIGLKVTEKSFGYGRKMPIVKDLGYIRQKP